MEAMGRRKLLTGVAAGLGGLATGPALAPGHATGQTGPCPMPAAVQAINLAVSFGPAGHIGEDPADARYLEQLLDATIAPPLSDVFIYAHGWLTDANNLMMIYNILVHGLTTELRALRAAAAPSLALPTAPLLLTTHWPSRHEGGPTAVRDLTAFSTMEMRANLVGETGMAQLAGSVWARLLAHPALASTRLHLVGHSFGCRILCAALTTLAVTDRDAFTALQLRNRINLILLQPALPADALEPDDLSHAHPFAQLVNYQNLRILATMSRWDFPLSRFYPIRESQQPSDPVYALAPAGARKGIPAFGGAGPTDATWRAFNGDLPRAELSVGPGFRYDRVIVPPTQRLAIADLTPLHAAHREEDRQRPARYLAPFGRPDRYAGFSGYHSDIYCPEIYQLVTGFMFA